MVLEHEQVVELEQVLGGQGTSAAQRLGVGESTAESAEELRARALTLLKQWRAKAENPLTDRATAAACRLAARSCEGVYAELR